MDIIELSDDDSVKEQVVIDLLGDSDGESGGASTSTKRARTFGGNLTNTSGLEVGSTTSKKRSKGKLRRLKGEVAHEIKQLPNDYEALSEEQYQDALTRYMGNVEFAKASLVSQLKPKQTKKKQPKKKKKPSNEVSIGALHPMAWSLV